MVVVERQFEQGRREIVTDLAPVQARVHQQDIEPAVREGEHGERENPMADAHPQRVAVPYGRLDGVAHWLLDYLQA